MTCINCNVINNYLIPGTEGPSPMIHVIVQTPPSFTVTPVGFYLKKIGDTLELPCDARDGDGTHRPTIVWIKVTLPKCNGDSEDVFTTTTHQTLLV